MRKAIYLILLLTAFNAGLVAQVNGELVQQEGKTVLHVWGNHQQRGYAHGYLLSEPIMQIFEDYIYQIVTMSNPAVYNAVVNFYLDSFTVEQKYQAEAQGIIDGMTAAGTDTYVPGLQRQLNKDDLLTFNAIVDIVPYLSNIGYNLNFGVYCASLSSWGTATQADTLLAGNAVITRFLDWDMDDALVANPIIMVSHPSEPEEQKWLTFGFPGLIGSLSGISQSGKAAFLNMGNVHDVTSTTGLHPMLFSIRNGLEMYDTNYDGTDDIGDLFDAIAFENYLSGTIVHVISENPEAATGIIEANNSSGTLMRTYLEEDAIPGMNLAATNHFRTLYSPVCCTRYANIADSLTVNGEVNAKRQLSLLCGAAGLDNNMMAIQYTPSTGKISWSTAEPGLPAYQNLLSHLDRNDLFAYNTAVEDEEQAPALNELKIYPNPAMLNETITVSAEAKQSTGLEVYNLKGQKIASVSGDGKTWRWNGKTEAGKTAGSGIYLLRLSGAGEKVRTARLLLLQ
jgi:hypothetical protein